MLKKKITGSIKKIQSILNYTHVRNTLLENRSTAHALCMTAIFSHIRTISEPELLKKNPVCKGFLLSLTPIQQDFFSHVFSSCFSHEQPFLRKSIYDLIWKGFPDVKPECYKVRDTSCAMNPRWDFPLQCAQFPNNSCNALSSASKQRKQPLEHGK